MNQSQCHATRHSRSRNPTTGLTIGTHTTHPPPPSRPSLRRSQAMSASRQLALSLYRRSLKLSLSWCVRRDNWRQQAVQLRHLFELNRHVTDPRILRGLLADTEAQLEKWKHPDHYVPPTAPGGSKYERNVPAPYVDPPVHIPNI
ncbi:hypothetical protein DFH27DRAFT_567684 [Peziza echinospora]|nr:hypothetical protein DFH27DRAFT_587610 [Peziza echinospora]KAI5793897.1 hypothetical protein DFH27DRAFT_567684 [Peziza echinospora]